MELTGCLKYSFTYDLFLLQVGNIVIKRPEMVDYETTTSYRLLVTATDLVVPVTERRTVCSCVVNIDSDSLSPSPPGQATTYVSIAVIDENDNVPQLSSDVYTGFVNEQEPSGTSVILVYTQCHSVFQLDVLFFPRQHLSQLWMKTLWVGVKHWGMTSPLQGSHSHNHSLPSLSPKMGPPSPPLLQ